MIREDVSEYSLWTRDVESEILSTCRELGIGFVAYSPLGRGFLAARFKSNDDFTESDFRKNHPRFIGENFEQNLKLLSVIEEIAKDKKAAPAQIALAWVLSRGNDIVPIPGTKRIKYLEQNASAAAIKLNEDELNKLEASFPQGVTAGTRYPERAMNSVNR